MCGCGQNSTVQSVQNDTCNYTIENLTEWLSKVNQFITNASSNLDLYNQAVVTQAYVSYLASLYQGIINSNNICAYKTSVQQSEDVKNRIFALL